MYTKPLVDRSLATLDISADLDVIGRLLLAASLNSGFRAKLLRDPRLAVRGGVWRGAVPDHRCHPEPDGIDSSLVPEGFYPSTG
jgi:hypothetical protein